MLDAHRAKLRESMELTFKLLAESERIVAVLSKRHEQKKRTGDASK